MSLAIEYHTITGTISSPSDGLIVLRDYPTTGPLGTFDVALDPIHGGTMTLGVDFGITGVLYDTLTYNLESSAIKGVRQKEVDMYGMSYTGPELKIVYNKE